MIERDWYGLYAEGWADEIMPDAYAHPAKFARALIRRMYAHAVEQGWLGAGSTVVDPFGGVALGALDAMRLGMHWTGCELEPKFVELGGQNIERWNSRYSRLWPDTWGTARLLQGDSRELAMVVGEAAGIVSSPPYAGTAIEKNSNGVDLWKQYQSYRMHGGGAPFDAFCVTQQRHSQGYGSTPGQLGSMRPGDWEAVVSSPPYADAKAHPSIGSPSNDNWGSDGRGIAARRGLDASYGSTPGQLGSMRPGDWEAVVSSPPFEESNAVQGGKQRNGGRELSATGDAFAFADDNLGNSTGSDFWTAARAIMEQCRLVLRPGGIAMWVTKGFIRRGQLVDFPGQWQAMGEACGFETLEIIRAWVVEEHGAQYNLMGELQVKRTEWKSFFRRLAEQKGSPRIDWETVIVQRRKGLPADDLTDRVLCAKIVDV